MERKKRYRRKKKKTSISFKIYLRIDKQMTITWLDNRGKDNKVDEFIMVRMPHFSISIFYYKIKKNMLTLNK